MAQIHALTPEGRLPSAAQAHVLELTATPTVQPISTGIFGIGDRHITSVAPGVYKIGA